LVYFKIIQKEEQTASEAFSHLPDETDCIQITRLLTIEACCRLYPQIRRAGTVEARAIVETFMKTEKRE
jgi:hypothetical protein